VVAITGAIIRPKNKGVPECRESGDCCFAFLKRRKCIKGFANSSMNIISASLDGGEPIRLYVLNVQI